MRTFVEKEGYKYPTPEKKFELPSKPTPSVRKEFTAETVPVTYLPPTIAETYLPPVTTRVTTPRTTTTRYLLENYYDLVVICEI